MELIVYVRDEEAVLAVKNKKDADKKAKELCRKGIWVTEKNGTYTYYPGKLIYRMSLSM
jgi:hypothetical protein